VIDAWTGLPPNGKKENKKKRTKYTDAFVGDEKGQTPITFFFFFHLLNGMGGARREGEGGERGEGRRRRKKTSSIFRLEGYILLFNFFTSSFLRQALKEGGEERGKRGKETPAVLKVPSLSSTPRIPAIRP